MNWADCPSLTRSRLQEYDLQDPAFTLEILKPILIERILESGTREEVKWLFSCIDKTEIANYLQKHGLKKLSRPSQIFWGNFFNIPIPESRKSILWEF
jgi:hypothetical protein